MVRSLLIILICLALATLSGFAIADITGPAANRAVDTQISTNQYTYDIARTVTTNDTALAATTKDWGSIGSTFHAVPSQWTNVTVSFYAYGDGTGAGSPNNGTFDFAIYVARKYGGATLVCSNNDAVVGQAQLSHNPTTGEALSDGAENLNYCWVDTTAVTTDWPTGVNEGNDDGADEIATLSFDMLGNRGIYIIVNDMTNVTSVTYSITGFGG